MPRDYIVELKKQLSFIDGSCRSYDNGNYDEGVRIATQLRILFHKSSTSKPIIDKIPVDKLLSAATNPVSKPGENGNNGVWPIEYSLRAKN